MTDEAFTLYGHERSGNAYKVALMMSLTATPFEYRRVDLDAGEQRGESFRAVSPYATVPVLVHGEAVIRQSNTCLLHLAAHTRRFASPDAASRQRISEWLFFEQEKVFPGIGRVRFLTRVVKGDPKVIEFLRGLGETALDRIEHALGETPFLAGAEPTIADVGVYAYARLAEEAGYDTSMRPRSAAWRAAIEALPGWAPPAALMPVPDGT